MKILYAIQGTGNGHLSRANDIIPILMKHGEVDILISGIQADVTIPYKVKYQLRGMSFIFGKKGGVNLWQTWKKTNTRNLWKEIRKLPIKQYDIVVNDFEPVSAWAAKLRRVPCISLSHQAAVLNKNAPKPKHSDWMGKNILRYYAPAKYRYGFHFERYGPNIFTPVIRQQIRDQELKNLNHYTVYLPAYSDEKIIKRLSHFPEIKWEVFSKHTKSKYKQGNVNITPINNEAFIESLATCKGILCGAGFETPAEALFLGKKLLVIPMKSQYEQQCNAASLEDIGVAVLKNLKKKRLVQIEEWLDNDDRIAIYYPNNTEFIVEQILERHVSGSHEVSFGNALA